MLGPVKTIKLAIPLSMYDTLMAYKKRKDYMPLTRIILHLVHEGLEPFREEQAKEQARFEKEQARFEKEQAKEQARFEKEQARLARKTTQPLDTSRAQIHRENMRKLREDKSQADWGKAQNKAAERTDRLCIKLMTKDFVCGRVDYQFYYRLRDRKVVYEYDDFVVMYQDILSYEQAKKDFKQRYTAFERTYKDNMWSDEYVRDYAKLKGWEWSADTQTLTAPNGDETDTTNTLVHDIARYIIRNTWPSFPNGRVISDERI